MNGVKYLNFYLVDVMVSIFEFLHDHRYRIFDLVGLLWVFYGM